MKELIEKRQREISEAASGYEKKIQKLADDMKADVSVYKTSGSVYGIYANYGDNATKKKMGKLQVEIQGELKMRVSNPVIKVGKWYMTASPL